MRHQINTETGTFGIWDEHALDFITDKNAYMHSLTNEKDIVNLMNEHKIVLWGTGGDGTRAVEVRLNPSNDLTDHESKYIEMESKHYSLEIKSNMAILGSPEWAGSIQKEGLANEEHGLKSIELPNVIYDVKIYFLAWDYEDTTLDTLPEYIIVIKDSQHKTHTATQLEVLG